MCSAVYRVIRSCYATPTPIWPSVKYELQTFRDLMIVLASPWRLPWCNMVTPTDFSLSGFGATRATWPIEVVKRFGRVSERLRFKKMPQGSSRTKALVQAGFYNMIVKIVGSKGEHEWVHDMTYEEIPAEYLRRTLWSESLRGRWRDPEDVSVLEFRTVVKVVFDILKFPHVHHHRLLFIGRQHGSSAFVCSCGSYVVCV